MAERITRVSSREAESRELGERVSRDESYVMVLDEVLS